jgi:hypothetical protein
LLERDIQDAAEAFIAYRTLAAQDREKKLTSLSIRQLVCDSFLLLTTSHLEFLSRSQEQ